MPAAIPWDAEIYPLLFMVAGAVVVVSLPRQPVGWLMLFVGACFAVNAFALQWVATGHDTAAAGLAWWAERGSAVLVPAMVLLVVLLPDGRLPSHAWRPVVRTTVVVQLGVVLVGSLVAGPAAASEPPPAGMSGLDNPFGLLPHGWSGAVEVVIGPVLVVPFLLGAAAVVRRLRRPAGDERPRTVVVLVGVLVFVLSVTVPDLVWASSSSTWLHIAGVLTMTVTIVVATVRGQVAPVRMDGLASVPPLEGASVPVPRQAGAAYDALSPREREVMEHVARGMTNAEIAEALVISPITVRNHVSSILTKLDVFNRTQAVVRFLAG